MKFRLASHRKSAGCIIDVGAGSWVIFKVPSKSKHSVILQLGFTCLTMKGFFTYFFEKPSEIQ